jgi:hypothetical protein
MSTNQSTKISSSQPTVQTTLSKTIGPKRISKVKHTKKYKSLSIEVKAGILKDVKSGIKQTHCARKHDVTRSTVSRLVKNASGVEDTLKTLPTKSLKKRCRTLSRRKYYKVEKALLKYMELQRELNLYTTHNEIRSFAKVIDEEGRALGIELPTHIIDYSKGWLDNFLKAYNISYCVPHGESASVNLKAIKSEIERIRSLASEYRLDDIYNCDETSLSLRGLPVKMIGNKRTAGYKIVQYNRASVLFCCNASGSDKKMPVVVGKFILMKYLHVFHLV